MSDMADWHDPETVPQQPAGTAPSYIVAVRRKHGKIWTFPAQYLNRYELHYEYDEPAERKVTGWFKEEAVDDNGSAYEPLLSPGDELIGWSDIPLHPLDHRRAPKESAKEEPRATLEDRMERMAASMDGDGIYGDAPALLREAISTISGMVDTPDPAIVTCPSCSGIGQVSDYGALGADFEGPKECPDCGGAGQVIDPPETPYGLALRACADALSGWRYIRQHHGDLYGVGWDRVENLLMEALSKE